MVTNKKCEIEKCLETKFGLSIQMKVMTSSWIIKISISDWKNWITSKRNLVLSTLNNWPNPTCLGIRTRCFSLSPWLEIEHATSFQDVIWSLFWEIWFSKFPIFNMKLFTLTEYLNIDSLFFFWAHVTNFFGARYEIQQPEGFDISVKNFYLYF